jgi:hypothetical protein
MGTEISSEIQLTNEEFTLIQKALQHYSRNAQSAIKKCYAANTGKVTNGMKIRIWEDIMADCELLESKLAEAFS